MKKQLLFSTTMLIAGNSTTMGCDLIKKDFSAAKACAKGTLWSALGSLIITGDMLYRLTQMLTLIQKKIDREGAITIDSSEQFLELTDNAAKECRTIKSTFISFLNTLIASYCYSKSWNNFTIVHRALTD